MRIKSVSIQGFRGFNEERTIDFHDRLTLIHGPNSYGKTSISEAFEWLLYGVTSKVENADSKDEYKGSYRNSHTPGELGTFVKAIFVDGARETEFRGDLLQRDAIKRSVDGKDVESWPLSHDLSVAAEPFILQHALKRLLLATPDERFRGFARLLGLEDLGKIHQSVIALCTKPDAKLPPEVGHLVQNVNALGARLAGQPSLASIAASFKKGKDGLPVTWNAIARECKGRVPVGTAEESVVPELLKIREDAVGRVFKGRIALLDYSAEEKQNNTEDEEFFLGYLTEGLVSTYTGLIVLATVDHILKQAEFFDLGVKLLDHTARKCPLCGQTLDDPLVQHIRDEHGSLVRERERNKALASQRDDVLRSLRGLGDRIDGYHARHIRKSAALLALQPSLPKLATILAPKHQVHLDAVKDAISQLELAKHDLEAAHAQVGAALDKVAKSIHESNENPALLTHLGDRAVGYVTTARSFAQLVSSHVPAVSNADQILKHELDALAGTEDITVLVDLLEGRKDIDKKFEIDDILDGLKELRKTADEYAADRVLGAISQQLTSEVMEWYGQIKTKGDPDVHFGGFDLERTSKGAPRARRVQIRATSYGKELVSAVSSLSESKLNALGLCVSIATNLNADSPFGFLIVDDPIQSWDAEHEVQFMEVVRKLVERGKQVILLSHNRAWLEQLRGGCRTINGWFYEITGYTQAGPHICEVPWEKWTDRLGVVDAILKNPTAGTVTLQQAEEEIRIVIAELASELYCKAKGVRKSPHNLNSAKVRKILLECGVQADLVDRIVQTFHTTDDAHHAPVKYAPNRQRIRKYHGWAHELAQLVEKEVPPTP